MGIHRFWWGDITRPAYTELLIAFAILRLRHRKRSDIAP